MSIPSFSPNRSHEMMIRAPLVKIFAVASNLQRWPEFLPHWRYNRYLSQTPSGGLVKMSCLCLGLKMIWVSEYRIDTENRRLNFHHKKSSKATLGMEVVWNFVEMPEGFVRVSISHKLDKGRLIGPAISFWVVKKFLLKDIEEKTLAGLKRKVEAQEFSFTNSLR
jgi:ribosome-associated toxin RatA of RatAB toxin-antitoxin module